MASPTSLLFRWRVQFGLTARKAPQLATVALADGAANEVPALAALRDLVGPPDGMMTIELEDGRRVFAPAGNSPALIQEHLKKDPFSGHLFVFRGKKAINRAFST